MTNPFATRTIDEYVEHPTRPGTYVLKTPPAVRGQAPITDVPPGPLTLTIPLRLVSESNQREHWAAKAKRVKRQRQAAYHACWEAWGEAVPTLPLTITILRIAPRAFDSDNLASSIKSTQDGVADWLSGGPGRGEDRHPLLTWQYAQRTGKPKQYAVEITLERTEPCPCIRTVSRVRRARPRR